MPETALLALSTFPDIEIARRIANDLVAGKLAACANILPAVESIYRWKEKIENEKETLVFFKTTKDRQDAFERKLRELHPYEVPEIVFIQLDHVSPDYFRWVIEGCRS